jgi:biopolymer transport protein ExbD
MKKCSASHHHALAEMNITPLLDLAFVLLVIFIITTTPVTIDRDIDLPSAAKRQKDPKQRVQFVSIEQDGTKYFNSTKVDLALLHTMVLAAREKEPDLNVVIRGSGKAKYKEIVAVMDILQQSFVGKVNLATEPLPDGPPK